MYTVDNAIIMAAGVSSRFVPLSLEKPKALTEVKGEVLIERQIQQLQTAGIHDIYIVVGYMAEQFGYLTEKYGVQLVLNENYMSRNNHSSIYAVKDVIRNSYICSADNYFDENPFESQIEESYYAAVYATGNTHEWCMQEDAQGYINHVQVGGCNAWYMLGHAFWSEDFSKRFLGYLEEVYDLPQTANLFWEDIFIAHMDSLKMKMRKYPENYIFEFDSIDELRLFDESYVTDTRSALLKSIADQLDGEEAELKQILPVKSTNTAVVGIQFVFRNEKYSYSYDNQSLRRLKE